MKNIEKFYHKISLNNIKIKRRNFFFYLGAAGAGVYALTKLPYRLFQQKLKAETSLKIKENPYSVKRDTKDRNTGKNNG